MGYPYPDFCLCALVWGPKDDPKKPEAPFRVAAEVLKDPLVFPQRFKDAAARTLIQGRQ